MPTVSTLNSENKCRITVRKPAISPAKKLSLTGKWSDFKWFLVSFQEKQKKELSQPKLECGWTRFWGSKKVSKSNVGGGVRLSLFLSAAIAKDLGITWAVVVLFHLSHFLFKRNLSEKKFSLSGNHTGVILLPSHVLYQLSCSNIVIIPMENFSIKFQKPRRRPRASPGSSYSSHRC